MKERLVEHLHACVEALAALVFLRWRLAEGGLADLLEHGDTLKPARALAVRRTLCLAAIVEEMQPEVTPPLGLAELSFQLLLATLDRAEEDAAAEQLRAWLRELTGHGADGKPCPCAACVACAAASTTPGGGP